MRGVATVVGAAMFLLIAAIIFATLLYLLDIARSEITTGIEEVRSAKPDVEAAVVGFSASNCVIGLPTDFHPRYAIIAQPGTTPRSINVPDTTTLELQCPSSSGITNVTIVDVSGRVARTSIFVAGRGDVEGFVTAEANQSIVILAPNQTSFSLSIIVKATNPSQAYWPVQLAITQVSANYITCTATRNETVATVIPPGGSIAKSLVDLVCQVPQGLTQDTIDVTLSIAQPGTTITIPITVQAVAQVINSTALGGGNATQPPPQQPPPETPPPPICDVSPSPLELSGYKWYQFDRIEGQNGYTDVNGYVRGLIINMTYLGHTSSIFNWEITYGDNILGSGTVTLSPGQNINLYLSLSYIVPSQVPEGATLVLSLSNGTMTCKFTIYSPKIVTLQIMSHVGYIESATTETLVIKLKNIGLGTGYLDKVVIGGISITVGKVIRPGGTVTINITGIQKPRSDQQVPLQIYLSHGDVHITIEPDQVLPVVIPATPWLPGFTCRVRISISNRIGRPLPRYTIKITVSDPAILSATDGKDLRFVDYSSGVTILGHWVQEWTETGAIIWVKLDIPAQGTTIFMYACNPTATDTSNILNVISVDDDEWDAQGGQYRYESFISNRDLFNPNIGNRINCYGDDIVCRISLFTPFPYYDNSYISVYIDTNGYISISRRGSDWSSTCWELRGRQMIAVAWADLMTRCSNINGEGIYVAQYSDPTYGSGTLIRWRSCFYYNRGEVNAQAILFRNGIIALSYGRINGRSHTDNTFVVGVSRGFDSEYTTIYCNTNPETLNNHPTIILWPRKYISPEPSVSIGQLEQIPDP